MLKKASWTTSAGFADFYVLQTTSPDYNGDYSNLSVFVVDKDEIEAKPEEWDAMGLRGNQSGTLLLDWKFVPENQLVGDDRRRRLLQRRVGRPELPDRLVRHAGTASRWVRSTSPSGTPPARRTRTWACASCDYPTIQDTVGEAIMDTNASRLMTFGVAHALDLVTDGSQAKITDELARGNYLPWLWQIKFIAAKNVAHVVDKMLHCCGGTGFKKEPLQLERYLRDGKAGWVMGPTNEVLRQFVGKTALLGIDSLDYWNVVAERARRCTTS